MSTKQTFRVAARIRLETSDGRYSEVPFPIDIEANDQEDAERTVWQLFELRAKAVPGPFLLDANTRTYRIIVGGPGEDTVLQTCDGQEVLRWRGVSRG